MDNLYIEGLQGMGKSTLLRRIKQQIPEYSICEEGDYSPVDLAWCSYMTKEQYQKVLNQYNELKDEIIAHTVQEDSHYIVMYTKILTDVPRFHKDMEQYEIYNGRIEYEEFRQIVWKRFQHYRGENHLFECAFFQNIIENLMLYYQLSDEEIVAFYKDLYEQVEQEHFRLIYLDSDQVEENVRIIEKERCDQQGNPIWYNLMLAYIENCPYGIAHKKKGFDAMIEHFRQRQNLEKRIIHEIIGTRAKIVQAKEYDLQTLLN